MNTALLFSRQDFSDLETVQFSFILYLRGQGKTKEIAEITKVVDSMGTYPVTNLQALASAITTRLLNSYNGCILIFADLREPQNSSLKTMIDGWLTVAGVKPQKMLYTENNNIRELIKNNL